jgi:predicted dehydrogenase
MTSIRPAVTSRSFTRRQFVGYNALVGAGVLGFPAVLRSASPNSLLQVASVGVGGMGGNTLKSVASHAKVKIVALCDVDEKQMQRTAQDFTEATQHRDWREMLRSQGDRTIGTPDHMHAAPAVTAIRAKKHVYLQKPMATTLHECRVITEEAAKAGVVTQLGNQGRSSTESRMTVELIRRGAIGKIKEVYLWENKPLSWWPKNTTLAGNGDPVPAGFDWDLWLGVREPRPFHEGAYHPKTWRAWFDFGVGELGDMAVHHLDITFDALKLKAPLRVRQTTPSSTGPLWGEKRVVEMIFPGNELTVDDTVRVTWFDGGIEPDRSKITLPASVKEFPKSANYWFGESGSIFKYYGSGRPFVLPEAKYPLEKYPRDIPPRNHYHDWVDAIFAGRKACADFSHGGPLSEAVLVAATADRFAGEWLEWDRAGLKFKNHPGATALVRRKYREGWRVPGLG